MVQANANPLKSAKLFPMTFHSHHHKSVVAPLKTNSSPASSPSIKSAPLRKSAASSAISARTIRIPTPPKHQAKNKPLLQAPKHLLLIHNPQSKIHNLRHGLKGSPTKSPSSASSSAVTKRMSLPMPKPYPPTSAAKTKNALSRSRGFWKRSKGWGSCEHVSNRPYA